jgi:hypothetical protein
MRPPCSAISGNWYIAGSRNSLARSNTKRLFWKNSRVASTLTAPTPDVFAASSAGTISSGVFAEKYRKLDAACLRRGDQILKVRRLIDNWIGEHGHMAKARQGFQQQLASFAIEVRLEDAGKFITKQLPETEQHHPAWQTAVEALILVAETDSPTMLARIGVMLALKRDHRPTSEPRRKAVKKYEG